MNKVLETLFMNFLETAPTGPLAAEMQRLSSVIDQQVEAGNVDADIIGDYECAAMKYGFAAGYAAAMQALEGTRAA